MLFLCEEPGRELPDIFEEDDFSSYDYHRLFIDYICNRCNDDEVHELIQSLREALPESHFIVTDEYVECIKDTYDLLDAWKLRIICNIAKYKHYHTSLCDITEQLVCVLSYAPHSIYTVTDFIFNSYKGDKFYILGAFDYHV